MSELFSRPSAIKAAVTMALTSVLLCCACAAASAAPFFSPASPWNTSLPADAALDSDSDGLVAELNRQVTAYGPWVNSNQFSVPVYTVPQDQPGVSVHIDYPSDMYTNRADAARLERMLNGIPIPPGARPAAGTDKHLVIWQPSTDTMWELWLAHDLNAGSPSKAPDWHANWGAKISNASQSDGAIPAPYGATASGLALAGGLITNDELRAGEIDHALALAIPQPARGAFVAPATRTDGKYTGPHPIPEGTRFRLPADVNINRLGLPPVTRMMAVAARKYGILVRDGAGAVVFYAQDPVPSSDFIFRQLLGTQGPDQALGKFPWSKLQAVSPVQPVPPAPPAENPPADPPPPPADNPPAPLADTPPASDPPPDPPTSPADNPPANDPPADQPTAPADHPPTNPPVADLPNEDPPTDPPVATPPTDAPTAIPPLPDLTGPIVTPPTPPADNPPPPPADPPAPPADNPADPPSPPADNPADSPAPPADNSPASDPPSDPPTPPADNPPADPATPPAAESPPAHPPTAPADDPATLPTDLPAPPLTAIPPTPTLTGPLTLPAPPSAPTISVQPRQRIAKALRRGVRIRCITRAGGRCNARVTTGRRVLFSGSGTSGTVTARPTSAGRRLLAGARRQTATAQVTAAPGTRATRNLTFVR